MVQVVGLYTGEEAREAIQRRSSLLGQPLDDLAASAIAQVLGNDPVLIGLHDLHTERASSRRHRSVRRR